MATRNVTYQFETFFATFDRQDEADQIAEVEAAQEYVAKFDVNIEERETIDNPKCQLKVVDDELVIQGFLLPGYGE